jgi:hypothetical protein
MKKLILIICLLVASLNLSAQTATANLNITLSDVLILTVTQPAELTVNFDTETKYSNGITATALDHITIISTKGYVVKVIAGTPSGPSSLTASSVKLTTAIGATNGGNTVGITYVSQLTLPTAGGTALAVITASNSSWNGSTAVNKFNVVYLIGSSGAYAGKTIGSNVIPVVYTAIQP